MAMMSIINPKIRKLVDSGADLSRFCFVIFSYDFKELFLFITKASICCHGLSRLSRYRWQNHFQDLIDNRQSDHQRTVHMSATVFLSGAYFDPRTRLLLLFK